MKNFDEGSYGFMRFIENLTDTVGRVELVHCTLTENVVYLVLAWERDENIEPHYL